LATAGLDAQKSLAELSQALTQKTQELETLREAITVERADLEQLHGKEIVAASLDALLAQYDEKRRELEASIQQTRADWNREQLEHEQEREREEEKYQYELKQSHRQQQDRFQESLRVEAVAERDRKEQLEKGWALREEGLRKAETELVSLREQVAAHPEVLRKAVEKEVAIVGNTLKKDHAHEVALLKNNFEAASSVLKGELAAQQRLAQQQAVQIAELTTKLEAAYTKVQETAAKALDATNGQAALQAVQRFAETNGSSTSKTRS
jgi:colicin import membrane protein